MDWVAARTELAIAAAVAVGGPPSKGRLKTFFPFCFGDGQERVLLPMPFGSLLDSQTPFAG